MCPASNFPHAELVRSCDVEVFLWWHREMEQESGNERVQDVF